MGKKRHGRVPGIAASAASAVWRPLQLVEEAEAGETFANGTYRVTRLKLDRDGVRAERADDLDAGLWLVVQRLDGKPARDWRHLQQVKNELAGPEREACELFVSESRLVDVGNSTHLWVLPAGERFLWGPKRRMVLGPRPGVAQRPFEPAAA